MIVNFICKVGINKIFKRNNLENTNKQFKNLKTIFYAYSLNAIISEFLYLIANTMTLLYMATVLIKTLVYNTPLKSF